MVSQGELRPSFRQSESEINSEEENQINLLVGDRVRWLDSGAEMEGVVSNVSGSRCAVEYQNSKGKTRTVVLSTLDVSLVDED